MAQMNVAGAIARLLETMGTEFVFGMNGHANWALLDAIVHETRIRGIPVRAEDQTVHMADGYWRMKRAAPMAIVATSVGPGNMNIVSAVASAFYGSIAMLVLAGVGPTHWFDRGGMTRALHESSLIVIVTLRTKADAGVARSRMIVGSPVCNPMLLAP